MKYWPKPVQKSWLAVYCDGLCIGIMQESAAADREKKRLLGLKKKYAKVLCRRKDTYGNSWLGRLWKNFF